MVTEKFDKERAPLRAQKAANRSLKEELRHEDY